MSRVPATEGRPPTEGLSAVPDARSEDTQPSPLSSDPPRARELSMPKTRTLGTQRSHTPHDSSRTRSSTHSPRGSPPLPSTMVHGPSSPPIQDYFPPHAERPTPSSDPSQPIPGTTTSPAQQQKLRAIRYDDAASAQSSTSAPGSSALSQPGRSQKLRSTTHSRTTSGTAGDINTGAGLWASSATETANLSTGGGGTSEGEAQRQKPSGMLGFLSRKKGRERSPKARERGVLGKEGARAIVGG